MILLCYVYTITYKNSPIIEMHLSKTRVRNVIVFIKILQYKWHGIIIVLPNNVKDMIAFSISKFHKNHFNISGDRFYSLLVCSFRIYPLKSRTFRCVTWQKFRVIKTRMRIAINICSGTKTFISNFSYSSESTQKTRLFPHFTTRTKKKMHDHSVIDTFYKDSRLRKHC